MSRAPDVQKGRLNNSKEVWHASSFVIVPIVCLTLCHPFDVIIFASLIEIQTWETQNFEKVSGNIRICAYFFFRQAKKPFSTIYSQ